ncbi:DUF2809 domain-containing protein [Aureimonas sp. AU40]|uniref:ribosomal maturation YjgA family protein n=1 Tax=Aureimonas sp. AU40 TaxID=1637747 RepID=UPI00078095A3|nr:DUF2809 domain-containing protein [Aureimonas sp. AU40]
MLASESPLRRREQCLAASVVVIAIGLALRMKGYRIGLPFVVVKYGGSLLWGSMVYFLVAALACRRSPRSVATLAFGLAVCVELFRLYHTPWLDAFRLTTAGALLLGRVFSLWNVLAYALGIAVAAGLDHWRLASDPERR